ncbi:hypothetical protein DEI96_001120 [Curtobacterium sp. MCLR17_031]|uniref:hypothetical protein n=1 Tax=Curtobacterium sp. MCLR17_031 TaxID=2175622 RepID=UPI0011B5F6D2|nr:hypothetical protein [Curtobacterium sp. MCLR17_031]WIE58243.1 hypothetical protein DEI96_001120 [Curtobacterium sp. MCLR17_031]
MTLVIATAPDTTGGALSVAEDVRLTRAGLLYADKVELWSPAASLLATIAAGARDDPLAVFEGLLVLNNDQLARLGIKDPPQARAALDALRQFRALPRQQRRTLPAEAQAAFSQAGSVIDGLTTGGNDAISKLDEQWTSAGGRELTEASDAGLLDVRRPDWLTADQQIETYVEQLAALIEDPRRHMLFDEPTAELVSHLREEGRVAAAPRALLNAREAGAGTRFIEYLQAFPQAPMSSVISARGALHDELVRYRRAVAALSMKLDANVTDSNFDAELEHLWRTEVQPALIDLRAAVRSSRVAKDAAVTLGQDKATLTTAAAGASMMVLGIAGIAPLGPGIVAGAGAVATAVAAAGVKAVAERSKQRETHPQRDLQYLLSLEHRFK